MIDIDYICPIAKDWNKICELLVKEYRATHVNETGLKGLEYWKDIGLPIPLILNGWTFSSKIEKSIRWKETLDWAEQHKLLWVIENMDFEKYR